MSQRDLGASLRSAGLRPTVGRQTVFDLMQRSDGKPLCCEDLYRQAMAARRSLNVSSIAHALSDLERAGLLVRATVKEERRLFYRLPTAQPLVSPLILQLEQGGRREAVDDPRFASQMHQWLARRGVSTSEQDQVVICIERAEATCLGA